MIKLRNVTKYFQTKSSRKYILKDVTFDIPANKNIAILGRNGAGKSTLMRMLGNIEFPNRGKIVSDYNFSWPLGLGGGFVGNMTGKQNVKFVCRLYGLKSSKVKRVIDYVKDFSELGDYFEMPIKTYSSGMRSRLNFGLSLAFDFDYLLIDETLSVGDMKFKQKSKKALMEKIKKSNIILVSHSMKDLKDLCDVGIVLYNENLEFYDSVDKAVLRYEEINLLEKKVDFNELKNLFFTNRNQFLKFIKESYIYIKNNNLYLSFLIYFNKKNSIITYELNNKFLLNLNETTAELIKSINSEDNKDILAQKERKLIEHFFNFIKARLNNIKNYYYLPENITQNWVSKDINNVFFKRRLFLEQLCKKNLIKDNKLLDKIKKYKK